MTLLAPLAALVAAAFALPTLLALYFLKLRRQPVRVSSTMLWEKSVRDVQVNVPFRWIRFSLPLLLQALALAAIVLAIGRLAVTSQRQTGSRIIILIDRSASMSATDGQGAAPTAPGQPAITRLQEAQRRAAELVDQLRSRGDLQSARALVATFASTASSLTDFTADSVTLREAIESITPTDQPGNLSAALRLMEGFIGDRTNEIAAPEPPTVFLFSAGSHSRGVAGDAPASDAPASGPVAVRASSAAGLDLRFERVGPAPDLGTFSNLGIIALGARREPEDPVNVRFLLRASNSGPASVLATIRLTIDGEDQGSTTLTIPGRAAGDSLTPFAPGEAAASLTVANTAGGIAVVTLQSPAPDLLAADDAVCLILPPPTKPRVLLVGPGQGAAAGSPGSISAGGGNVVVDAQTGAAAALRSVLSAAGSDLRAVEASAYPALAPTVDRAFDLIVFDRVRPPTTPPVPTINFASAPPIGTLAVGPLAADQSGLGTRVLTWQRNHPVLRAVPLDDLVVAPALRLTLPAEDSPGLRTTLLAEGATGPLIAQVESDGVRHVVIALELAQSNLPELVAFPLLMANAVEYLTLNQAVGVRTNSAAASGAGRFVRTDEPISVQPEPGARLLTLSGPLSAQIAVPQPPPPVAPPAATPASTPPASPLASPNAAPPPRVALGLLERTGLYRLDGSVAADRVIAVNLLDPLESDLRTRTTPDAVGIQAKSATLGGPQPREVWRELVMLALGLLAIEWVLYAWMSRK